MPTEWNTRLIAVCGGLFGLLLGLFFELPTLLSGSQILMTLLKLLILSGVGATIAGGMSAIRNLFVV